MTSDKLGGPISEGHFRLLVESIKDYAIFMLDPEGRVASWNAGAEAIKGYRREEILGRSIATFYAPEDVAQGKPQALLAAATSQGRVEDEGWRVRKDGSRFWADVVITALRDPQGNLQGFGKVTRDLSWRKAAEDKLRKNEASLAATLYSIGDGVLVTDERGRITRMNALAERLTGWPEKEALGRTVDEVFHLIHEQTRERAQNPAERVLAEGVVVGLGNHSALVALDGTERPITDSGAPIRGAQGETLGAVLVFRDATDERRAQEALAQSEESLAATLYSIGDAVLATDERAQITRINPVAERLTGWSEKEAVGRPIDEVFQIINEETRAKGVNPVDRVLREGVVVGLANHTALISRDGSERPIADSGAPIHDASGRTRGAVLVFRDVTEERRHEEALRLSEQRLRLMIASVSDYAIYMLDPEGHVVSWNPGAERIKGYRPDEILGAHFSRFFTPEDLAEGKPARALATARSVGRFEEEAWRVRQDGSHFWANVVITPIRDAADRLVGFVKVTRDLTEAKRHEEERLRLAQAQEAIRLRDDFLSIASHELRTPLTAMQLLLESIRGNVETTDPPLAEKVQRATRIGDRLAQLIEMLLDVSRIATGKLPLTLEPFDLVDAAREVILRMAAPAAKAGCALSLTVDAPAPGRWDRLRIEQIITNILANAVKYGADKPIDLSIGRDGDRAVLEIRDNGPGVPDRELARIFERFERASSTRHYGGLGLGLYVARQIAEAHQGSITARNLTDGGACFSVRLPISES